MDVFLEIPRFWPLDGHRCMMAVIAFASSESLRNQPSHPAQGELKRGKLAVETDD
jgi:hypothetical protein